MGALEVRGPTLKLRYATAADAPALLEAAGDPEVTRFFSWGPYRSLEEPLDYISSLPARRERGELLDFVIDHAQAGPIGVTGVSELSRRDRRATIGTWLGRAHWGGGANAESKALLCALAFGRLGLERLTAYSATANPRSQAALQRLGFVREGVLRRYHRHGDEVFDLVVLSLLADEWRGSPLAAIDARISGEPPGAFVVA